jgi:rhamnopyranosyl-N-acetylglucosaminyl-diphospho-decaprenol beta-1,3/1,4-galactofuranosyltransferase
MSGVRGVLVTYRRPDLLRVALERLSAQRPPLDRLVVVDNDPLRSGRDVVEPFLGGAVEYLPTGSNSGPAGGRAAGIDVVLVGAEAQTWIAVFDDDDPVPADDLVARVRAFGERCVHMDPTTAGVGLHGGTLDLRIGRLRSVTLPAPADMARVDYLSGGWFSMYRAGVLRETGSFYPPLFYGLEELELGLRLRRAGYRLFVSGELHTELAPVLGHAADMTRPSFGLGAPDRDRYYDLRNMAFILRRYGYRRALLSMAVVVGVLKPLLNLPAHPRDAATHLRLGLRAIADGMRGRLGPAPDEAPGAVLPVGAP